MFELSNQQRKCFGLLPVEAGWERMEAKPSPYDDFRTFLYLDGNTVVKIIHVGDDLYTERELREQVSPDRVYLLPKTVKGKPAKLSASTIAKRKGTGMALQYSQTSISLYSEKSECNYYCNTYEEGDVGSTADFFCWADAWCRDTTQADLAEIARFSSCGRRHVRFREGDVFRFKINRRLYGYGRVLLDYDKMRRDGIAFWDVLMCKPVVCSVYHVATERDDLTAEELQGVLSLPSTIIADNHLYYGEYAIIGHIPIRDGEDYPILYGRGIDAREKPAICYQCGKVFRKIEGGTLLCDGFRNNGVSFVLDFTLPVLQQCIAQKSNVPYWSGYYPHVVKKDLRNPEYAGLLKEIRKQFGL